MARRIRHGSSLFVALSMPRRMVPCQQKIILNIFWTGGLMRCGRVKTRWRTKMSGRTNLMAMMNLPTRRQVITGVAAAAGVFALGSTGTWAGAEEEVSRTAESIHMEPVFKASRKRVYEALTETKQFDKVIRLSAAMKSGIPADAKPTEISREAGGAFSLFGGYVMGRRNELAPKEQIVQAWRAGGWGPGAYSIATFELAGPGGGTKMTFATSASHRS